MRETIDGLSPAAKCARCDMGEDESVEHVVLEYEKYERDRMEMMQVILIELGHNWNESGEDRKGMNGVAAGTVWRDVVVVLFSPTRGQ